MRSGPLEIHKALVRCVAALCVALAAASGSAEDGVTPDAGITPEAAFRKADANRDGKLSRDECAALTAILMQFAQLDRNQDGFLDLEEFTDGYRSAGK